MFFRDQISRSFQHGVLATYDFHCHSENLHLTRVQEELPGTRIGYSSSSTMRKSISCVFVQRALKALLPSVACCTSVAVASFEVCSNH